MQPAIRLYRRVGFTMLQSRVVGSRESGFRLDSYVWFSCVNESSAGKGKRLPAMGTINPSLLSVRNPAPEGSVEAAAAPVYFCNSCCRGNGLNEAGVEVAAEAKGLDAGGRGRRGSAGDAGGIAHDAACNSIVQAGWVHDVAVSSGWKP
eukprot:INCI19038.1.p1 GENE.INCI19038.1~~INCI19038.1.p1  ORF type:complete len:165 (+),score=20.98 INCI19038.1:49-495(+)